MSTDYNYDEQGQYFPYFILTITALITLPTTYSVLAPSKELENTAPRIQSDFKPEHADLIEGQRRKQKRRERKVKRMMLSVGGWLLMAWMVYLMVVTTRTVPKIWDPYDVLGISRSLNEKEIKKHYRKLSLTQHPDKVTLDPERNITTDSVNNHWVDITKAYKALTDDEIRNNYLQYGHPDGKQSFSIGIALPKFLIEEGNGKYALLLYGGLLAVFLPYIVGRWWYGSQRVTKEGVLVTSAGNIFREYQETSDEAAVITTLSSGEEFDEVLSGRADSGLSKLEQKVLSDDETSPLAGLISEANKNKLKDMEGVRRKALGLLWAYLGRIELEDESLNDEKLECATKAIALNESYSSIALAYGNIQPLLSSYRTSQCLIQAFPPGGSPLLQLPFITPTIAKAIEGEDSRRHLRVTDYMNLPADIRKKRSVGPDLLTPQQYQSAVALASQLPNLHVEKAFFKVVGEKYIVPNSFVQFIIKARLIPPGSTKVPDPDPKDLEEPDPKGNKTIADDPNEKREQPPLAHAPYFPRDKAPQWHVFLADGKQGKLAVPPFTFNTFNKAVYDEAGNPTYAVLTLRMQFGAPPQAGKYTFACYITCDSYVGLDTKIDVTMNVEDASKAEAIDIVDDDAEIARGMLLCLLPTSIDRTLANDV
ncbi:hypothetical protein P152DRAFT_158013 [Eremomyces bilateralis CBS 781.70]|uniref:J domain-containing protein n=1 Tax=Eremomyces bilateralis CBS 781.70 TaxID=1392243 RepID=A0A6G1FUV8_9PEZI|nr:uncharacterized protein P152DRAFT_158013 [Eremomyces bilateralis CBS 781.70]KAF1809462.1 hypothetical protein P152DRAFT_158013 [Eremomyces bilateralis CBS 781.70]